MPNQGRRMLCGVVTGFCAGIFAINDVLSVGDFQHHIAHHRQRVIHLGLHLAENYFPDVSRDVLSSFLALHDYSKTNLPQAVLERAGWQQNIQPFERLYDYFGKNIPAQEIEFKNIIKAINEIDKLVAADFFIQHKKVSDREMSMIYKIEKVADLVDRSKDPLASKEFGRPMKLASSYLSEKEQIHYAQFLEDNYFEIVQGRAKVSEYLN